MAARPIRFDRRPGLDQAEWFRDPTGAFSAGFRSDEAGRRELDGAAHELHLLLAGRVRITTADGHVEEFGMGDAFLLPQGLAGSWETMKATRGWYVTWQPPAADSSPPAAG
jgi:uncharacterized cupin superfamily protein